MLIYERNIIVPATEATAVPHSTAEAAADATAATATATATAASAENGSGAGAGDSMEVDTPLQTQPAKAQVSAQETTCRQLLIAGQLLAFATL